LTQTEILSLATALHNQGNGIHHYTFFYDADENTGKQLNHVIALEDVEHMEVDDTYYSYRQLEIRGFKNLRILKEPGWVKRLIYRIKWHFEDKKAQKLYFEQMMKEKASKPHSQEKK
jgi:hypothetical protein